MKHTERVGRRLVLAVLLVGTAVAGPDNPAQTPAERPGLGPELFRSADANGDGRLTFDEVKARFPNFAMEKFKARDRDGDGYWSPADLRGGARPGASEAAKAQGQRPASADGQLFKRADANGDGSVTYEEVRAIAPRFPEARFVQLDRNRDGALTKGELAVGSLAADRARPLSFADMLFARADANRDGKVTYPELTAVVPEVRREDFARADENGDGALSTEESRKAQRGKDQQAMVRLVQSADANQDQQVTFEELAAVAPALTRARFDQIDRNGDGILTSEDRPERPEAEIREARVDRDEGTRKIIEADVNGDGKVEFEELIAAKPGYPRETFDRHDVNKDGVVSGADLMKARL